jgi:hypothetical protein
MSKKFHYELTKQLYQILRLLFCSFKLVYGCTSFIQTGRISWTARGFWKNNFSNTHNMMRYSFQYSIGCTRWRSWLRHCATRRKVAGSIPDGVVGIFNLLDLPALGSTRPLTEMSIRGISWCVRAAGVSD